MTLRDLLYPKQEIIDGLSFRNRLKINTIVFGSLFCIMCYILLGSLVLFSGNFLTAVVLYSTGIFFLCSYIFLKLGRLKVVTVTMTVALLAGVAAIGFFGSRMEDPIVVYRTTLMSTIIAAFNYALSIRKYQLHAYHLGSYAIVFSSTFLNYGSIMADNPKKWIGSILINTFGIFCTNMFLLISNRQQEQIMQHSEMEHKEVSNNLEKITNVLSQAQESLNAGKKLNQAANSASESVENISNLYKLLIEDTGKLENQTNNIKTASEIVNTKSVSVNESIAEQNNDLADMSSAMQEISANLSNVNQIAQKRQEGMKDVIQVLDEQNELSQRLVSEVQHVQDSSQKIAAFVKTVDDIANQTNLLAMNASIESAHAGEAGKGFGVIAQEIRKLSEETTKNAKLISDTLQENTQMVQEASFSVQNFVKTTAKSSTEIKQTLNSMEEILNGIQEMDVGTRDVMNSVQKIVNKSEDNSKMIQDVVSQIGQQTESISLVTESTNQLKDRVQNVSEKLTTIADAMVEVHNSASESEEISAKINKLLV